MIKSRLAIIFLLSTVVMFIRSKNASAIKLEPYAIAELRKDENDKKVQLIEKKVFMLKGAKSVHSCSISNLSHNTGDRAIVWFGGTREGASDVNIYLASLMDGAWNKPYVVASPASTMINTFKYIKKVGNPVLTLDKGGLLHLLYVTTSIGGWSTSQIQHIVSKDKGKTWNQYPTLSISPFFNISTLVRSNAVFREDGSFDIPAYSELIRKMPELLHFSPTGKFVNKIRMTREGRFLQPSIVPTGPSTAFALERDGTKRKRIHYQATVNKGAQWSSPIALNVPNPGSSVAVTRVSSGHYIMIFNPYSEGRSTLALAISSNALNWKTIYIIESAANKEFSYPSLFTNGNMLEVCYSRNRQGIGYVKLRL